MVETFSKDNLLKMPFIASRSGKDPPSGCPSSKRRLLGFYILFGAIHELTHALVAAILCFRFDIAASWPELLYSTLLGRSFVLTDVDPLALDQGTLDIIRHAGWIVSVAIVLLLEIRNVFQTKKNRFSQRTELRTAALLTALEAIATDLLQLSVTLPFSCSRGSEYIAFHCGNFGIIVLHHMWFSSEVLDLLEKMIQVTMIRGAQSGGVITYIPQADHATRAVRTRVVNGKRTDLARTLRDKVQRDVFGPSCLLRTNPSPDHFIPCTLSGHTRFATSSKATLDGTHPHIWTPKFSCRLYDLFRPTADGVRAVTKSVENYVTHNGDFDFYKVPGVTYDLDVLVPWLERVTHCPRPALVDSVVIAGFVDVLRTQGCFGLSVRYAICGLGSANGSTIANQNKLEDFPQYDNLESIGLVFEQALEEMLKNECNDVTLEVEFDAPEARQALSDKVVSKLKNEISLLRPIAPFVGLDDALDKDDQEVGKPTFKDNLQTFCIRTVDAFFDNDLFFATKTFLQNAKGSFGLCISSSLDAHRQVCLAARGQTMSVAFYPKKGLICFGSEQASVKAAMNSSVLSVVNDNSLGSSTGDIDNDILRLDLDDFGGEVVCIDWSIRAGVTVMSPVSKPNRGLVCHKMMNGQIDLILFQQSKATTQDPQIFHRMTCLSRNRLIKPLYEETEDLILTDICDIPKVCRSIQDQWKSDRASTSLNRLTAYNLSRCLRNRLESHVNGTVHPRAVDILLTGCEVSLWLAEQFASDLQKSFPALNIQAVSSNKLLGLYGQEIAIPTLGFPYRHKAHHMHGAIVIIVSHSGGTFAPLSCSNLLQSSTENIFVVTSEWDTQIGKQLRLFDRMDENFEEHLFRSRIFSTEVGMRPAEPCSLTVVATHQLLTNLFEYICAVILSDERFRRVTCAHITEEHLHVLEKCNQMNILALSQIVGVNEHGLKLNMNACKTEAELRASGDVWAEHILEVARAYIMTFVYIFATVVSGYPLCYAIAHAAGLKKSNDWIYLIHTLDAAIYFWLPQINITLVRLWQGRNMLHRMVGRTVVIGDIPYVAQCAEAFLSKIFAVSYSIAGLNVLSGNPSDHFVHRHTHRVVRGSLIVCGRPDGRLSALATTEAAVCLSVNQASCIQSLGGTCESITIGHNRFKLPLSAKGIFLPRNRPMFLCERLLVETDVQGEESTFSDGNDNVAIDVAWCSWKSFRTRISQFFYRRGIGNADLSLSRHLDTSLNPRVHKYRSAAALTGAYMNLDQSKKGGAVDDTKQHTNESVDVSSSSFFLNTNGDVDDQLLLEKHISREIRERSWSNRARKIFQRLDLNRDGVIGEDEFIEGMLQLKAGLSLEQARQLFMLADTDSSKHMTYDEFLNLLEISDLDSCVKLPPSIRNSLGIIQIEPSQERYFGETLRKYNKASSDEGRIKEEVEFRLARSQDFSQELYETRVASIQRFVSMVVLFHQMGKRVRDFFSMISFGWLSYRFDRTHSILRIASTASPVSGADVLQRMQHIQLIKKVHHSIHVISVAYLRYKARKERQQINLFLQESSSSFTFGSSQERHQIKLLHLDSSFSLGSSDLQERRRSKLLQRASLLSVDSSDSQERQQIKPLQEETSFTVDCSDSQEPQEITLVQQKSSLSVNRSDLHKFISI